MRRDFPVRICRMNPPLSLLVFRICGSVFKADPLTRFRELAQIFIRRTLKYRCELVLFDEKIGFARMICDIAARRIEQKFTFEFL